MENYVTCLCDWTHGMKIWDKAKSLTRIPSLTVKLDGERLIQVVRSAKTCSGL